MKRKQRMDAFSTFYQKSYESTMNNCLVNTGDFIGAEDLLYKIYHKVYRKFMKSKEMDSTLAEKLLSDVIKHELKKVCAGKKKDVKTAPSDPATLQALLEEDLPIGEDFVEKKMLLSEYLTDLSQKTLDERRAFVNYFYFGKSLEEIAKQLKKPEQTVCGYLVGLVREFRDIYLDE